MTLKLNYNVNMSNILLGTRRRSRTSIIMVYSYTLKQKFYDDSKAIVWKKHVSSSTNEHQNRNQYIMMRQFDNYNRIVNPTTIQRRHQLIHHQQYTTSTMMSLSSSSSSSFDDILKEDTNKQQSDYLLLPPVPVQPNEDYIISGTVTNNNEQQLLEPNRDENNHNENQNQNSYHQRRIRYNGKYPRNFHEKYKELQYDTITIQKKLIKGITPAGQHIPIMIQECMYHLGFMNNDNNNNNNNDNNNSITTISSTTTTTSKNTSIDPIVFVDCTLGYGGHSMEILRYILQLQQQQQQDSHNHHHHRMICFDQDPIELPKATERLYNIIQSSSSTTTTQQPPQDIVTTVHSNFRNLRNYIENNNINYNSNNNNNNGTGVVTSLLADLGLSSMQIDDASRGFTYKYDGPLDMRMNTTSTIDDNNKNNNNTTTATMTAYDLLCNVTVSELTRIIHENSDEEYASIIAKAIVVGTKKNKDNNKDNIPTTTVELANLIRDTVRPYLLQKAGTSTSKSKQNKNNNSKYDKQHQQVPVKRDSAIMKKQLDTIVKRVMQAIRIEINHEFDSLQQLLDDLPYILKSPGGKAVILTFHSGEDRRVKKAFKDGYKKGIYSQWSRDVVRPTSSEQYNNPRSTCCKLRWVIRSDQII